MNPQRGASSFLPERSSDPATLIETIRAAVIGDDEAVAGPFGLRRVTYADYTASGRSLGVHRGLHPRRGPAALRQHAHRVVRHGPPDDALPRGGPARSSATAVGADDAPRRDLLRLRLDGGDQQARRRPEPAHPGRPRRPLRTSARGSPPTQRPVVFIGPFEHHSNELPWRESIADVVVIHEDADGHIDLAHLEPRAGTLRRPAAPDRQLLGGLAT